VPLLLGDFEGAVRIASARLLGRRVGDEALIPFIREQGVRRAAGRPACAGVLRDRAGPAIVGVACWRAHPLWPAAVLLDVYCHPSWWHRGSDLLRSVPSPSGLSVVAHADATQHAKRAALAAAGFTPAGVLPRSVPAAPGGPALDVATFTRP
jgi:hypothetical protein